MSPTVPYWVGVTKLSYLVMEEGFGGILCSGVGEEERGSNGERERIGLEGGDAERGCQDT